MSAPQNFRTSFNGFNKEDVVRYLEYINSRHAAQVNQLTGEADYLRNQLDQYQGSLSAGAELESLRAQYASLQEQLEESLSIRKALEARCNGLQQELDEALEAKRLAEENSTAAHCRVELELEAYRRAERMERTARERAQQIHDRATGILADATAQVEGASDQIGCVADSVLRQLEQLCQLVDSSKHALKNASESMYALRPEQN